jgi:uncharacterized surface protein with fasciclin (FAS1) repeats
MKNNKTLLYLTIGIFFSVVLSTFFSCEVQEDFSYKKSNSNTPLTINAWEFIQQNDSLALLEEAITLTGIQSFYEATEKKTFIAPTNEAFKNYLANNSYQDLSEVPVPILRNALKYHIVNAVVSFDDPNISERNNPLPYTSENGQTVFLSRTSGYTGLINEGTNKQWTIITSNIKPTNGVVHILDDIIFFSARLTPASPDPDIVRDTIYPIADSYVNGGGSSGRNYGSEDRIKVKSASNKDYLRKGFLMFNLKDFTKEGVIVEMNLELNVKFTAAKGIDFDILAVQDTTWTESGITFDNAPFPTTDPIASITTSKISAFQFDILDYYKALTHNGKVAFMLDQENLKDETDEFWTKENTGGNLPSMLIARFATGNTTLVIERNTGFTVNSGEAYALNSNVLEVSGATAADISFTIQQAPQNGWFIRGASVLQAGESFTQEDVDVMNVVYINNGNGTDDKITVTTKDKAGASLPAFDINITVQ